MAEVKNMLHKVQHLFLSTSVSAQSCRKRGGRDGKREWWMGEEKVMRAKQIAGEERVREGKKRSVEVKKGMM